MNVVDIAKELISSGKVTSIIGYTEGTMPGKTKTFIARTPEQAGKFIFNKYCANNLTVYLTKKKLFKDKPIGIFVKSCDAKTIVALMQEKQIKREDVYLIGVVCEGITDESGNNLLGKCMHCIAHTPKMYDTLIGEPVQEKEINPADIFSRLNEFESLSQEEKWNFWMQEFDKCVKCYACRQACPLCYCEQCIVDKSQPRWIDTSAHTSGNLNWHLIRAFHLAGRCIGCGECDRVCHQNIPLSLLNMKMAKEIFEFYVYRAGGDPDAKPPLTDFKMDDNQDFIK
jgi:formate dehydrogenase (coenzyme F420) beta subunit